jgi:hypothetical protein
MQEAVLRRDRVTMPGHFEICCHVVVAGSGFVLIAARPTGNTDCPDGFVSDPDWHSAPA